MIKQIAPGNPKSPIKILVKILSPMWKPHIPPIKLIKNIVTPPKTEFITNFKIFLIGTINTLPNINKKQIHAKYIIKFVFIFKPSLNYIYTSVCLNMDKYELK